MKYFIAYELSLAFFKSFQNDLARKLVLSREQSCLYRGLVTVKAKMSGGKNWRMAISVAPIIALGLSKSSKRGANRPHPAPNGAVTSDGMDSA